MTIFLSAEDLDEMYWELEAMHTKVRRHLQNLVANDDAQRAISHLANHLSEGMVSIHAAKHARQ